MKVADVTMEEIISKIDGATGRLIVASRQDPVVKEAMEMVMAASLALGELAYEMEEAGGAYPVRINLEGRDLVDKVEHVMGDIEPDNQYEYRMYVGCGGWLVLSREAMINLQENIARQLALEVAKE